MANRVQSDFRHSMRFESVLKTSLTRSLGLANIAKRRAGHRTESQRVSSLAQQAPQPYHISRKHHQIAARVFVLLRTLPLLDGPVGLQQLPKGSPAKWNFMSLLATISTIGAKMVKRKVHY
jgi:hypothetical protein